MKKISFLRASAGVAAGILSAVFVAGYITTNKYIYAHHDIGAIEYSLIFAVTGGLFATLSLGLQLNRQAAKLINQNKLSLLALAVAGALAVGILTIGQQYTTAMNASLLMTTTIVVTAIFSHALLGEKYARHQLGWIVLLFLGVYIGVVGFQQIKFRPGDLIVLGSVIFFAFGNAYSRVVMKRMGGAGLVPDVRLSVAGLLALVLALFVIKDITIVREVLPLALLAGLFYWLTMKSFAKAVYLINSNNTIVLNNAQIFFTSIAGILILSEPYSWEKLAGSLVAITAIYHIAAKK